MLHNIWPSSILNVCDQTTNYLHLSKARLWVKGTETVVLTVQAVKIACGGLLLPQAMKD